MIRNARSKLRTDALEVKEPIPKHRPYMLLARYYDQFFHSHIPVYRHARRELLRDILPQARSACDLACGTGTTAIELRRQGINAFAVDLSATMCRLARSKARSASVRVVVIRGDMRTFCLPEPVDLVTCEYNALNHVPQKADLARTREGCSSRFASRRLLLF